MGIVIVIAGYVGVYMLGLITGAGVSCAIAAAGRCSQYEEEIINGRAEDESQG